LTVGVGAAELLVLEGTTEEDGGIEEATVEDAGVSLPPTEVVLTEVELGTAVVELGKEELNDVMLTDDEEGAAVVLGSTVTGPVLNPSVETGNGSRVGSAPLVVGISVAALPHGASSAAHGSPSSSEYPVS
jgi:hypothetical protein